MADHGVLDKFFAKVMADVLTSSREELLGEGLDVAVLQELQTRWQQKLQESKASAAEARLASAAAPPPPPKAAKAPKKRRTAASVALSVEQPQHAPPAPAPSGPVRQAAPDSSIPRHSMPAAPAAVRPRNTAAAGLSAPAASPAIDPMALLGHALPAAPMGSFFLDFESGLPPVEAAPPLQESNKRKEPPGAPSRAAGAAAAPPNIGAAAAAVVEEEDEPLESDDDDDDVETSNLVVCQFDKVTHVKTKWKCTLLNGVMTLNGSEHVFNAGVGNFLLTF